MAIDERVFINGKRAAWEKLSVIVERTKNGGLKQLSREELPALGSLYRRAAADLAYARAQGANPNLVLYLNELVGNAHGVIYAEESGGWSRLWRFFAQSLPAVMRRRMPFVLAAILLNVIGALLAYEIIHRDPTQMSLYFPDSLKNVIDFWKKGGADDSNIPIGDGILFSSSLMTHNTQVGITAFATGITLILPIMLMFQNGTMIGALTAVVQPTGHLASMWAGLLPHGICELSATFICGGAGLCIGWALIAPGRYSRKDALIANGIDACKMMVGTIPLWITAGILEGNVSHSSLPHWAKFSLAGIQFAAIVFYIYGSRVKPVYKQTGLQPFEADLKQGRNARE
ncbi:MAG: stage II sporulation protein M [Janthinobacterium lividum]